MGFFRQQEERMAVRLLTWQYQRLKIVVPSQDELETRAVALVDEAHRIGRQRGHNVLSIMKELVGDLRKK